MTVDCDGIRLHVVHNAQGALGEQLIDDRPAILFLHGFPEFWVAWRSVFEKLKDRYLILAPDQRGYNLSDAPSGVENYRAKLLVQDMDVLTTKLIGAKNFAVAGHDWGGSIAYAVAMRLPDRVSHLIIANGVHPVCFQEAMIDDPNQAKASSYFHILRREDAARIMGANHFEKTFSMFEKFSQSPWLHQDLRKEYSNAWAQPGRLTSMLHWYNSSPIYVPTDNETPDKSKISLYGASRENFRITMPHLLIWGEKDQALLGSAHQNLGEFCDQLERRNLPGADHWLLHTHSEEIAREIYNFLEV